MTDPMIQRGAMASPQTGSTSPRRGFLARALGLGAGTLALAGLGGKSARAQVAGVNDATILNFALNFEYLGSEYYSYGLTGRGIAANGVAISGVGSGGPTTVKPGAQVSFTTPMIQQFVAELMRDEVEHVQFVRSTLIGLGIPPITKPSIDLLNSFNMAAAMAGLPTPFDPFANQTNFLLGAYMLEDVCVSALHGAAPLIKNKNVLNGSAGLLGVEAYQAGAIRTMLYQMGQGAATEAISTLRANASGVGDFGVAVGPLGAGPVGSSSIVLADANALALARTPRQVLNIVYLGVNATSGGFFPNGVNGTLRG